MSTYEEDIADMYYNLNDYFTIMNIPFSAIEKRIGGLGSGEIDVLAVKVKNNKFLDAVHAEVSVSISEKFPFRSDKGNKGADDCYKILKKFFLSDGEYKIKEILGKTKYKRVAITSTFKKDCLEKIKERMPYWGAKVINHSQAKGKIKLKINYKSKTLDIELIPFEILLQETMRLFKSKGLIGKNFQDKRYRAINYLRELSNG